MRRLTLLGQLDEIQLLALLWPRHMPRQKGVHERLEIRPPPLRKRITDLPILVDTLARELRSDRCKTLIQPLLESIDLLVLVV